MNVMYRYETMCGHVKLITPVTVLFVVVKVCALENLALNKSTWQQHPWPDFRDFGSENAVDGLYNDRGIGGECTISAEGYYTATWGVDLGSVVNIRSINVYYRTDNQNPGPYVNRMAGYSLYVSHTSSLENGHLCYKDESKGNPSVNKNIPCSSIGRYVIYYNERNRTGNPTYFSTYAFNELCEVQVFGCRWSFSDGCGFSCPINCLDGKCDTYSGHCISCHAGYHGQSCEYECEPGHYGEDCRHQCSINCDTYTCDRFTGHCIGGCKPGWTGSMCDQDCLAGYYGKDCRTECSLNCLVTTECDRSTGECNGGCKQGWTGITCDQT